MVWLGGAGAVSTQTDFTDGTALARQRRPLARATSRPPPVSIRTLYVFLVWSMVARTRYHAFGRKAAVVRILSGPLNQAKTDLLVTRMLADSPPLPRIDRIVASSRAARDSLTRMSTDSVVPGTSEKSRQARTLARAALATRSARAVGPATIDMRPFGSSGRVYHAAGTVVPSGDGSKVSCMSVVVVPFGGA